MCSVVRVCLFCKPLRGPGKAVCSPYSFLAALSCTSALPHSGLTALQLSGAPQVKPISRPELQTTPLSKAPCTLQGDMLY